MEQLKILMIVVVIHKKLLLLFLMHQKQNFAWVYIVVVMKAICVWVKLRFSGLLRKFIIFV